MDLAKEVNEALAQYSANIDATMDKVFIETAQEAVSQLKASSPRRKGGGRYARGWRIKKVNGKYIVHNKTDYQLTHLLENGHDIIRNGRKVGSSPAIPHIKPVEEWVKEEVVARLESDL